MQNFCVNVCLLSCISKKQKVWIFYMRRLSSKTNSLATSQLLCALFLIFYTCWASLKERKPTISSRQKYTVGRACVQWASGRTIWATCWTLLQPCLMGQETHFWPSERWHSRARTGSRVGPNAPSTLLSTACASFHLWNGDPLKSWKSHDFQP